jgi:hypothetical protein
MLSGILLLVEDEEERSEIWRYLSRFEELIV